MTRELYSATDRQEPTRGSLDDVLGHDVDARMLATLERIGRRVDAVRRAELARPVDPQLLDTVARAAHGPDAPFEVRWLAERVAAAELSWVEVWRAPETYAGGLWLWGRVTGELAGVAARALATLGEDR